MNVELKIQVSEIKKDGYDDLEWNEEKSGLPGCCTQYASSKITEIVTGLVIVEETCCNSMPEWDDVDSHEYLVALTKSGKKLRLFEIQRGAQ